MTTEDDFHAAIEANPKDRSTRLVFADWLDEHDDARAQGYRAIARLPGCDCRTRKNDKPPFIWMKQSHERYQASNYATLHDKWVDALDGGKQLFIDGTVVRTSSSVIGFWRNYETRREAEDAAAIAFSKLPESVKEEILAATANFAY